MAGRILGTGRGPTKMMKFPVPRELGPDRAGDGTIQGFSKLALSPG